MSTPPDDMPGSNTTGTPFHSTAAKIGTYLMPRTARNMPSSARLPACWTKEMDRFICHCDALGDVEPATIVKGLKKKFPELGNEAISAEAVQRRIEILDLQDNDYFKKGSETAVRKLEAKGHVLPPMDLDKYLPKEEETSGMAYGAPQEAAELSGDDLMKPESSMAASAGRVRLVDESIEDSRDSVKEHNAGKEKQENRDQVIPIKRMEGLPTSGTSAMLSRRAGLKDSGSLASLAHSGNTAATSSFDAIGRGSALPRSSSLQQGQGKAATGDLLASKAFSEEPEPSSSEPHT